MFLFFELGFHNETLYGVPIGLLIPYLEALSGVHCEKKNLKIGNFYLLYGVKLVLLRCETRRREINGGYDFSKSYKLALFFITIWFFRQRGMEGG